MSQGISNANEAGVYVISASLTPAEVATIVTVEQDFTVTGIKVGDAVSVNPPGITAGASIVNCRVKAADTISIQFTNPTAGNVTPLAGTHVFTVFRPEGGAAASLIAD